MTKRIRQLTLGLALAVGAAGANAATVTPEEAIRQLADATVSRLEWGLERLRGALNENFALDPLTLEPSTPRYFINVDYVAEDGAILIEIGRTLVTIGREAAKTQCTEYLTRVRGFLGVGKAGTPAVNGVSELAEEYFHPLQATAPPDRDFALALDRSVKLRALVAAPMSGIYSICTAGLTNSPIRYVE